ncbi:MAG TPA: glycoside hydrolase family 3 N-terminal domain-containing protein [Longimicrobiales bacterium]
MAQPDRLFHLLMLAGLLLIPACMPQRSPVPMATGSAVTVRDAAMERFVDSVLAGLTLEEKLGQLAQYRGRGTPTGPAVLEGGEADIRSGRVGSFLGIYGAAYTRQMQRIAVEESRARIPLLFAHDVIHGFRTLFPVSLAEAASWDVSAVEQAARIAATEAAASGLHWTFAPMVDIARDARWGRIVEGAGEDPYLGSAMAAARVRGFQGKDLRDSLTILATAKHFVAYGAAEAGRDYNTTDISERVLREVYLAPFKAAVDAGVASVMGAFNEVSGIPMHANDALNNGVLRREWGWDGVYVSDYTGVMELIPHGIAADSMHAGILGLNAGVDIDMVSGIYIRHLPAAVRAGRIKESVVDESVRRVLRAKYKLGLFEDPYRHSNVEREARLMLTPLHIAAAREMARKSMVLLKNAPHNGRPLLPLRKDIRSLAVIGTLADDRRSALGSWAAAGRVEDVVSVLAGIRAAVPGTSVTYTAGAPVESTDTSGFKEAVRIARAADMVIMVLGEHQDMSAEARNRTSVDLPGVQQQLLEAVHATGKPVVVVLMNGRPLSVPWLDEKVPAILEAWYLGVQMGPAVADVLFGDYSPSGKLPVTFPRNVGQLPLYYNHKNTGRPPSEQERYTSKYIDVPWTPLYPFGHGLSYTTFTYANLRLRSSQIRATDSLLVQVDVTNSGQRAGDEVVQLYVRDDVASVTRPVRELRGFARISLRPGETRTISFTLRPTDLAFYDQKLERVVEPGFFTVWVGTSSADERQRARFEVVGPPHRM